MIIKFCILQHSIVLTIHAESILCRLDFLVPRGRCGEKPITSSTTIVKLQNEHLFVFYDQQSTQNHKENVGLMKRSGHDK